MLEPLPFPRRINVEITNHCNQRCRLCPRLELTRPLGFMAPEVFARVAAECARHSTTLWLHFLGEPLLHRGLIDMIAVARRAGVSTVGLSTNAVALGTYTEALLSVGLDRLECSIDALDRERYHEIRGRDHFERVTENVRAFLARKQALGLDSPITSLQFMHSAELAATLPQVVECWRELLGPRDFIMTIEPASFLGAIATAPTTRPRTPCRWLFESLLVLQDGTVTMCGADWDAQAPLGNLREDTLEQIWNGAELGRRRAAHQQGEYDRVPLCGGCDDWALSDGHGYRNVLA